MMSFVRKSLSARIFPTDYVLTRGDYDPDSIRPEVFSLIFFLPGFRKVLSLMCTCVHRRSDSGGPGVCR